MDEIRNKIAKLDKENYHWDGEVNKGNVTSEYAQTHKDKNNNEIKELISKLPPKEYLKYVIDYWYLFAMVGAILAFVFM